MLSSKRFSDSFSKCFALLSFKEAAAAPPPALRMLPRLLARSLRTSSFEFLAEFMTAGRDSPPPIVDLRFNYVGSFAARSLLMGLDCTIALPAYKSVFSLLLEAATCYDFA